VELTIPHRKSKLVAKHHKGPRTWTESLNKRSKLKKIDMRFGAWNECMKPVYGRFTQDIGERNIKI
jgi:hypothetical protein